MKEIQKIYKNFSENIYEFAYQKEPLIKIIFINILINGSILIEDLPGVGKTTLSKAISKLIGYDFNRIQGTSDLIPQDIIGGEFYNFNKKEIEIRKGPIFSELLLIDEINRMNPKTQSAFLQAMEEKKVSIVGNEYHLDDRFFVIATQNPIEYSGTFPLPEAQKDRFTSKISLGIPSNELQMKIIMNNASQNLEKNLQNLEQMVTKEELNKYYNEISQIEISQEIAKKMVLFFEKIKNSEKIIYPLSQRGISVFMMGCRAHAYLEGRTYIIPQDGEVLIDNFLVHRLDIDESDKNILHDLYNSSFKHF